MSDNAYPVKYYAIVDDERGTDEPDGLMRRTFTPEGRLDEALQRDLTWRRNSGLYKWEHGDLTEDYVEISEDEAMALIERFRAKWAGATGGAGDT